MADPVRQYDTVYFGFWISHVPEDRFESFWDLVGEALKPAGRVFFFDDNHRSECLWRGRRCGHAPNSSHCASASGELLRDRQSRW